MRVHHRLSHVASECLPKERRRGAMTALLFVALAAAPCSGLAQEQLLLTADVGKTEFFEDEPIYLLVRLQNVGTDTARVYFFSLLSPAVTLSMSRGHGKLVEVAKPVLDVRVPLSWRGQPVPPGATFLQTMVLQDIMGDEWDLRSHLFAHHLTPDHYEVHLVFAAHSGLPRATPLTLKAAPLVFEIRARTTAEEGEVRELEDMRQMGWDTTLVAGHPRAVGYQSSLIHWVDQRLREQPDDPFLPFLLYNGLYVVGKVLEEQLVAGKVPSFDPDTSEVVSRLRLAVIGRHRLSTAGAHLVQGLTARHPDQLAILAEQLGATPGGEMARYQVERNQHAKQFRNQPPR